MNKYKFGIRAIYQKDIKTAILQAKRNGFDVLEIHFSSPQFLPQKYSAAQQNDIKKFAKKNDIALQAHSEIGQSLIQADDFLRKAERQKLERMVQFSKNLGCRCLTLHPGKSPVYFIKPGNAIYNDDIYRKFYVKLFEDSLEHIASVASKDLLICLENTDNFNDGYQKVLSKYLKANKVFLTWDIMKNYSFSPSIKLRKNQLKFVRKNIDKIRNIHISGPSHSDLQGYLKYYVKLLKLPKNNSLPIIFEIISLKAALKAKKLVENLNF